MLKQERKGLVNGRCLDHMVIFQHQGYLFSESQKLIEQRGQESLQRGMRSVQTLEKGRPDVRVKAVQSGSQIGPEMKGIVVSFIYSQPRDTRGVRTLVGGMEPIAKQSRFTKTGWGTQQCESGSRLRESGEQA
jgi:hypothetical protein